MILKNIVIFAFGVLALIFGSKSAIDDIVKMFAPQIIAINGTSPLPQ